MNQYVRTTDNVVFNQVTTNAGGNGGAYYLGDVNAGMYRDNTYDVVIHQGNSSGNVLYLASAGDVRVSIDSNNNTDNKFIVGSNAIKASNELFSVNESGTAFASADFRASLFRDNDNTGYYGDFAGTNNFNQTEQNGRMWFSNYLVSRNEGGMMGSYNSTGTASKVIWTIGESWPIGNMYGLGYEYGSGYDHHLAMRNNGTTYSRIGFAGGAFIGGDLTTGGNVYSYRFYDRDNTGYYCDPENISLFRHLIAQTASSYIRLDAYNNQGYFGMNNSGQYWGLMGNYSSQDWRLGYGSPQSMVQWNLRWDNGTTVWANGSFRAPLFYDSDNTEYYVDPNGGSYVRGMFQVAGGHGNSTFRLTARGNEMGTGTPSYLQMWVSEPGVTWNSGGFGFNVQNDGGSPSGFGRINTGQGQAYMRFDPSGDWYFYNTNTSGTRVTNMELYTNNTVYFNNYATGGNSLRAPIFYDSNNTSYYVDPNGTARLSYVVANGGIRIDGNENLYLDNNYGQSVVGVYTSTRYQGVFSMGNSYKPAIDGTSLNNTYGIVWSHPNTGGQASYLSDHGMIVANYGTTFAAISSTIWVKNDMRSPIYYDHNTGYYFNGDGESNWQGLTLYAKNRIGLDGKTNFRRSDYTGDSNHWTGARGWGTTSFNDQMNWGSGWGDSWGSIGQSPGDTSHYLTAQVYHYSYSGYGYGWQLTGGVTDSLWWRHSWPNPGGWFKIAMYDNSASAGGGLYAGAFYDSNDSGYYLDPNSTSDQALRIRGGALHGPNPTWGAYLYVGSNGRPNSWASVVATNGNLHLDCQNGYETYINHYSGNRTYLYEIRTNFIYDRDNTGYYCDPQSYSQFSSGEFNNYCRAARFTFIGTGGNSGQGTNAYEIFQEGGGWGYPYPDLRIAYHTGIKLGANAGSYEGTRVYSDYDMSDLCIQLAGSSNYSFKYKWMYTNDTGFYSGTNGAHWYPNNITYGAWRMDGNRNGWYGHVIDSAYLPHYMWESGNGGIYLQNAGRWVLYHSLGNNCTGMGTSATAGGYAIYCNGGVYATGNIVAYSDIRKKKDVVTVDNALDKILELRGVYYTKIYNENDTIPDGGADKRQLGVVAQEVNEVLPEVVSYTEHLDEYAVAYGNFAGLFIEGFKEQQIIISKQADEINLLKEELQKIKDLILNINKE
jgi:hypothetical protein